MSQEKNTCCGPDCCSGSQTSTETARTDSQVRDTVREGYAEIARAGQWSGVQASAETAEPSSSCCAGGGCCGPTAMTADDVATAVGYGETDLKDLPEGANMGLSCGNPTALASLKPGEVVLDLGSGGGFDCFIAGPKVGAAGRVIGVDMTPEMLSKARANTEHYTQRTGLSNVEFRLGEIEHIPAEDNSVDVIISNCVLNLSPDKAQVWREIARVLKPGGRVAVSDLALLQELPGAVRRDAEALVGCVAGAVTIEAIERMAREAGLTDIALDSKPEYVEAMANWEDPLYRRIAEALPEGSKMSDYITSLNISAKK